MDFLQLSRLISACHLRRVSAKQSKSVIGAKKEWIRPVLDQKYNVYLFIAVPTNTENSNTNLSTENSKFFATLFCVLF